MESDTPQLDVQENDVPLPNQTSETSDEPIKAPTPAADKEPLSKNALKRLLRKEAWEASAPERREARKLKKAAKKETRKALVSQGLLDSQDDGPGAKKRKLIESVSSGISLVIDLQFQDKMNDKELISTVQQVARSYSTNRYAPSRFDLTLTSVKGPIEPVFDKHFPAFQNWAVDIHAEDLLSVKTFKTDENPKTWVYLTADSPNTLTTLNKDSVYIIGGIVDKNRHKGLCLDTANALGLSHAKFPIDDILAVKSRRVLTINQVIEIMVGVLNNGGDWKAALLGSIPKRKGVEEIDGVERSGDTADEKGTKETLADDEHDQKDIQEPDASKGVSIPTAGQ